MKDLIFKYFDEAIKEQNQMPDWDWRDFLALAGISVLGTLSIISTAILLFEIAGMP